MSALFFYLFDYIVSVSLLLLLLLPVWINKKTAPTTNIKVKESSLCYIGRRRRDRSNFIFLFPPGRIQPPPLMRPEFFFSFMAIKKWGERYDGHYLIVHVFSSAAIVEHLLHHILPPPRLVFQ